MVTSANDGSTRFAVYLPNASKVELIGDFTDWREQPSPMRRDKNGWWRGRADLPEGDYQFCYLVDGVAHIPDFAASGICRNDQGGWVSRLHIGGGSPRASDRKKSKSDVVTRAPRKISA